MKQALGIGISISTTAIGIAVLGTKNEMGYSSVPNRPGKWHGGPAYNQMLIPGKIMQCLKALENDRWDFSQPGSLSLDVRQHDLEILDNKGQPLIPALSWQWVLAEDWATRLKKYEGEIGPLAARFILPKAAKAIELQPDIYDKIHTITTTGDWIVWALTGNRRLSTSDGISNGLLLQDTKEKAEKAIMAAGLKPEWIPNPVKSNKIVGVIRNVISSSFMPEWKKVREKLADWKTIASLGDNHAGGVGCGLQEEDEETIIVSFGSSGTTERVVGINAPLIGKAAMFEFYNKRLLLNILPDCDVEWKRFQKKYCRTLSVAELDRMALISADSNELSYPPKKWREMTLRSKAASTLLSIVLKMAILTKEMMVEAIAAKPIKRFIITGGLSNSPLIKEAFWVSAQIINPSAEIFISSLNGPLAFKASARGSLMNGLTGTDRSSILCPLEPISPPPEFRRIKIAAFFKPFLC